MKNLCIPYNYRDRDMVIKWNKVEYELRSKGFLVKYITTQPQSVLFLFDDGVGGEPRAQVVKEPPSYFTGCKQITLDQLLEILG